MTSASFFIRFLFTECLGGGRGTTVAACFLRYAIPDQSDAEAIRPADARPVKEAPLGVPLCVDTFDF